MHLRRVTVEHIGQALSIGTGFLDRIIVTGVLLRAWGRADFEVWAVCLALSGLTTMFDFGFSLYFNNRLMEEIEQGQPDKAARTLSIANTLFGLSAISGFAAIAGFVAFSSTAFPQEDSVRVAVVMLAAAVSLRIAATGMHSLFRAHRQYARLAFLLSLGEVCRIAAIVAVSGLGGGLLEVVIAATLAIVLLQVVWPVIDALRRFRPYRIQFAVAARQEMGPIFRTSFAFFGQLVPIILLTSLPVLYLSTDSILVGALTGFVLMRTLTGLPRTLLQQFAVVLGQECGRRLAVKDKSGASTLVSEGARFYAVLSGLATGVLLSAGREITMIWTGSSEYFRMDYALAAVAPMVVSAFTVLAHNILVTTNAPAFGTLGRWVQCAITVVAVMFLPVSDAALGMLLALTAGEVLGFTPLAYSGVRRLVDGVGFRFYLTDCARSIACALIALVITRGAMWLVGGTTPVRLGAGVIVAVIMNAALVPWLGVQGAVRRALVEQFIRPRLGAFAFLHR